MPAGTVTQPFSMPASGAITSAQVQVDPDSQVRVTASVEAGGNVLGTAETTAAGDTNFVFGSIPVAVGTEVTLRLAFSADAGKTITVYRTGSPGGLLTVSNACPETNTSLTFSDSGLRAIVWGTR